MRKGVKSRAKLIQATVINFVGVYLIIPILCEITCMAAEIINPS